MINTKNIIETLNYNKKGGSKNIVFLYKEKLYLTNS